jgi:hypothetical protein
MKYLLKSVLMIVITGICSCKQIPEPQDEFTSPAYWVNGLIDDKPIKINAGENDFYLSTSFEKDKNGIYDFIGEFTQNCSNCKTKLKFKIKNYAYSKASEVFNSDYAISKNEYSYLHSNQANLASFIFKLESQNNPSLKTQKWLVDDQIKSETSQLILNTKPYTLYKILLQTEEINNCQSNIYFNLKTPSKYKLKKLPQFKVTNIDSKKTMFKFEAEGEPNSLYEWDFGNVAKANGKSVFYGFQNKGIYFIQLKQIHEGDTNIIGKWIQTHGATNCISNFDYAYYPNYDSLNFSTVQIEYTDENGISYSSAEIIQNDESNFVIKEVFDSMRNKSNQKTKTISFQLNCKISNGNKILNLSDFKGRIAVAVPE